MRKNVKRDLKYILKRRYKQNLLETFYIVINSFTLSLDAIPRRSEALRKTFKNCNTIY